jgi:NADPH:quinone reductase-like Zn-dependent oxidoreductase
MRAIVFAGVGGPEVMRLEERPDPVPGDGEVLVAARFAALNTADLAQRAGNYPAPPGAPPDVPGLEVAGVVAAVGAAVRDFAEGDRVFGLVGGGGLADRVVAHERHLTRVPDSLSDEEAAAVSEAFITAHDAMVTQAGLGLGDVLLVNGANGGVGSAAVQIGLAAGARVLASARSARDRLAELGAEALPPDEAFERARQAGGADVILELVGAPNLPDDLDAVATRGRVVVVGTGAGADASVSLRALMGKRALILGTVLRARPLEQKALAVHEFAHEIVPHLASGKIRALVDRIFAAEDAVAAFDAMAASGKFGKILLAF